MTEMVERKKAPRYALELGLAVAGGWFAISTFLALTGSEPKGGMLTDPVMGLIAWIGGIPCLLLSLGFAAVGAWSFLASRPVALGPHCLGSLGTAVGLSILLGALSETMGGELGTTLVSSVPGNSGVVLGFLLGAAVIAGTVWLAWLPSSGGFYVKPSELGPVRAVSKKEAADGVSAAEAEALMVEVPGTETAPPSPFAISSPDADVRNRGGVPEGAAPLDEYATTPSPRSQGTSTAEPPDGVAAAPDVHPGEPAGADLAAGGPELGTGVAQADEPVVERADERSPEEVGPLGSATATEPIAAEDDPPIRPSWEQAEPGSAPGIVQTAFVEPESEPVPEPETTDASKPSSNGGPSATAEAEEDEEAADDQQAGLFEEAAETEEVEDEEDEEDDYEIVYEEDAEAEDEDEEAEDEEDEEEEDEEEYEYEEAAEDELEEEAAAGSDEELAEVEVEPAPRAAASKTPAKRSTDPIEEAASRSQELPELAAADFEELVVAAGRMILDENRVAVSMLQRRFGLDFKGSTAVLDVLQERGLIGPYLGGRNREILMNADEWAAKTG